MYSIVKQKYMYQSEFFNLIKDSKGVDFMSDGIHLKLFLNYFETGTETLVSYFGLYKL